MSNPGVRGRLAALLSMSRLGLFAGVGVLGAVVDTGVLIAAVELVGLGEIPGKVLAWVVAIVVIFSINERLTFAGYGEVGAQAVLRRLGTSYAIRSGGFLVTLAVYTALIEFAGLWYVLANVVGICVGFVVNYVCESLWTWKVHRGR